MAEIPKNRINSASNLPRTTRRRFIYSEKLRIVQAADRCTKPGELGLLLRREGLFFALGKLASMAPASSSNACAKK